MRLGGLLAWTAIDQTRDASVESLRAMRRQAIVAYCITLLISVPAGLAWDSFPAAAVVLGIAFPIGLALIGWVGVLSGRLVIAHAPANRHWAHTAVVAALVVLASGLAMIVATLAGIVIARVITNAIG